MGSRKQEALKAALSPKESPALLLSELYPALRTYWPNLGSVSVPQAAFLLLDCKEAFYGGAAGGGKCLTDDHDVLTREGWKPIQHVRVGDEVASWRDGVSSWERVAATHRYCYSGPLRVSRSGARFRATPNHKWRAGHRDKAGTVKKWRWYDATELMPQLSIPAVGTPLAPTNWTRSADEMELLGWWLSEGSGYDKRMARISQVKPHGRARIIEIAENLGLHHRVYEREIRIRWEAPDRHGTAYTKRIPEWAFEEEHRGALLAGLLAGDGYKRREGWEYSTSSRQLADDVQRLATLMGLRATLRLKKVASDNPHYLVSAYPRTTWTLSPEPGALDWEDFDGEVYCLTIPTTGTFVVRHGGVVHVTGNSDALLAAALEYIDRPGYAALIVRRSFPALSQPGAIMARSHEWLTGKAKWNEQKKTWTVAGGGTLTFGFCETDNDVYQYQGAEFQFIGFDELTQFNEFQYGYLNTRLRRLEKMDVPIRMRSASNPGGVGHGWVKKRFITEPEPGVVFIPAKVSDNPGLNVDEYIETLSGIGSPALRQQLLDGDWGVFEGAAFTEFNPAVHCIDPIPGGVPKEWQRFESLDFGINNPTAWLAYAVDYDGNVVVYDEYYAPGYISQHSAEILKRRALDAPAPVVPPSPSAPESGWTPWGKPLAQMASWIVCYADPSVRNRTGALTKLGEPASALTEFADCGVGLTPGNNNPVAGYARILEMLKVEPGRIPPPYSRISRDAYSAPRLFIVEEKCPNLVEQLRAAPLLPIGSGHRHAGEIVDPAWEGPRGHAVASLRYGLMSRPEASDRPETAEEWSPESERARFLRESEERAYQEVADTPWLYDF